MDTPMGRPTVLTPAEEQLLVSYILHMAVIGFPLTVNDLFTEVQKIVLSDGRKHKMKDGKPGELWRCWDYCSCHYRYLLLLIFIYFYFRCSLNTLIHWKHSLKTFKCQLFVKCQKVKHRDYGGGSLKKKLDIMMSRHNEANFDLTFEGHQNTPKCS